MHCEPADKAKTFSVFMSRPFGGGLLLTGLLFLLRNGNEPRFLIVTDRRYLWRLSVVWMWLVLSGTCVGSLVPRMMILKGGGTFKRWDLVGGF
jgi:hypothetical protein